jgi:hypothetical protein
MKKWFLLALVLAALTAGISLLWNEEGPSTEPANSGSEVEQSQFEAENSRLSSRPGERGGSAQNSARSPGSAAELVKSPAPADAPALIPPEQAGVYRTASDFHDDGESDESVIGGMVQDEEGNPLSDIEVLAEQIEDSDADPRTADLPADTVQSIFSDFDGAFLFSELEDGEYRVRLAPVMGIAPAQTTARAGTLNVNLVVVMLRDVRVYGTVNSTDGEPIEDVHIIAGPTTRSTRTGSRGEYELDISRQGDKVMYSMNFQHKDFQQQRIRIDPADLDGLGDFQLNVSMEPLKRLTTVTGRLTDTEGNAVGGKTLTILTSQARTMYVAESDARGNFLFGEVEPGEDYQLSIRPGSGYQNKDINPLVVPDGGLNLDIELEPNEESGFSGWMIDLDGNPIPGFSMTLYSTVATGQSVSVVSNQQGFFSVADFPVGGAMFRSKSYPVLMVRGIRVSAEPEEPVTVILDTGTHVLQGWVVDGLGGPVAAASITLDWEFRDSGLLSSSARKTAGDQNGNFVFTGLGPGLHTVQVSAAGFSTAVRTVDVGIDPVEITVELEEAAQ